MEPDWGRGGSDKRGVWLEDAVSREESQREGLSDLKGKGRKTWGKWEIIWGISLREKPSLGKGAPSDGT